VEEEDRILMVH